MVTLIATNPEWDEPDVTRHATLTLAITHAQWLSDNTSEIKHVLEWHSDRAIGGDTTYRIK